MKPLATLIVLVSVFTVSASAATFKNSSTKVEDAVAVRVGSEPIPGRPNLKAGEQKVIDTGSSSVEIYVLGGSSDRKTIYHNLVASFPSLAATDVVTCRREAARMTCSK